MHYTVYDQAREPLILEQEDWTEQEWATILKLFGQKEAERIVVRDYALGVYGTHECTVSEIMFRGKSTRDGSWAYGSLIHVGEFCCILPEDDGTMYDYPYLDPGLGVIDGQAIPVDPNTIGRFTGVFDRDDEPVYEGDIVKLDKSVKMFFALTDKGVVEYDHGAFFVSKYRTRVNNLYALTDCNYILQGEVIGNIFDNPKLLEDLEEGIEK